MQQRSETRKEVHEAVILIPYMDRRELLVRILAAEEGRPPKIPGVYCNLTDPFDSDTRPAVFNSFVPNGSWWGPSLRKENVKWMEQIYQEIISDPNLSEYITPIEIATRWMEEVCRLQHKKRQVLFY